MYNHSYGKTLFTLLSVSTIALHTQLASANQNQDNFSSVIDTYCDDINDQQPQITPSITNPNFLVAALTTATTDDALIECGSYSDLIGSERQTYNAQVTPDETPAMYTSLVQIGGTQISNIGQQVRNRRAQSQSNTAQFPALADYYGGVAGSELIGSGRLSVFLNGAFADGDQDDTTYEVGYDLEGDNYTLGLDYRLNNEWLVGFAYGYSDNELTYNQHNDVSENQTDHLIAYGSWYRDQFAVDLVFGYASGEFETTRHLPDAVANGTTDTDMMYFSVSGNYDFSSNGWTYGPVATLDYLDGDIDGFEESGDSVWNAEFDSQKIESMILSMGAMVSHANSFNWGVVVPHAKAVWRNEFEDDRDLIVGRFVLSPTTDFSITPDDPDSSWYQLSIGAAAVFTRGISAFIDYEEVLGYNDTNLSTITAGARLEF